jgi:hypothetical protein
MDQRFNNGWTFGNLIVNAGNSSAPQTEREVVSHHSYGRQIGRMMDAVVAMADKLGMQDDPCVKPLVRLAADITELKRSLGGQRSTELLAELQALKKSEPKAWEDLVKKVNRA